jgi:hypothetical protein
VRERCEPEVEHFHPPSGDLDVRGFQIAMKEAVIVRVRAFERLGNLPRDGEGFIADRLRL